MHGSLGPHESTPKQVHDRFSHFCTAHGLTLSELTVCTVEDLHTVYEQCHDMLIVSVSAQTAFSSSTAIVAGILDNLIPN